MDGGIWGIFYSGGSVSAHPSERERSWGRDALIEIRARETYFCHSLSLHGEYFDKKSGMEKKAMPCPSLKLWTEPTYQSQDEILCED